MTTGGIDMAHCPAIGVRSKTSAGNCRMSYSLINAEAEVGVLINARINRKRGAARNRK